MAGVQPRDFDSPDETRTPEKTQVDVVRMGSTTVGRFAFEPGWRWSDCVKPVAGTDGCQARHVGVVHAGRLAIKHEDGTELEIGPGEAYIIEPGHDAWASARGWQKTHVTMARDDRVLPETRVLGAFIVPFLLVAFPLLYFFPNDTGNWWAWEIRPSMTALMMGAGYIAGAYFFVRVARATRWHRVHLGFLPITAFTAFLGVATIIYWDWFDHDHVAFWIWTGLYWTTPFLVPLAWLRNRQTDPGTLESADDRYLPRRVRSSLIGAGLLQFAVAVVLIASPSTMVDIWPWPLDELGAATLGAWFALPGVTALMMGIDGRWSAIRITLESQLIGLALILLATARAWEQFDKSNALTYVFAGGIALLLAGLAALWSSNVLRTPPEAVPAAP